ncbi:hypothetical protein AAXE64_26935 [Priestia megaterium]
MKIIIKENEIKDYAFEMETTSDMKLNVMITESEAKKATGYRVIGRIMRGVKQA